MFFIIVWFCEFLPLSHCRFLYISVNNWFIFIVATGAETKSKLTWRISFGSTQNNLYFSNIQWDQRRKHNSFIEFENTFQFYQTMLLKAVDLQKDTCTLFLWSVIDSGVWRYFGPTTLPDWFGLEFKQRTLTYQENSYALAIYLRDH